MNPSKANPKQPSPFIGMTSITGQKLDALKAIYHDIVSSVVSRDNATLLFSHFGDFDTAKVENTLKLIESGVIESGDKRSTMKRVCGMLIELLQNISIHGARDSKGHMHAYLIVAKVGSDYALYSGNLILMELVSPMRERMQYLLNLDATALRKLYIEILCNEEYSSQGGAGLGLVTIVKRAENNVQFEVERIDEHFGSFRLEVKVPTNL
ncbi:MAG: SiaB family protein kinase [Flavobacteriales bacterium]|jgi:hypothetical protein